MIKVYIDGASAGNPGPSGAGVFIIEEQGEVERHSIPLGMLNNHEAEWQALIHALELCSNKKHSFVSFYTDSQLIEGAIEKKYVKKREYQPYLEQALTLIGQFDLFFIKWIASKENLTADSLARQAIQLQK